MTSRFSLFLCINWLALCLIQATVYTQPPAFAKPPKARLQLTSTIVDQKSCSPDHYGMRLRLRIDNVGGEPVIVPKYNVIARTMVSSDPVAAKEKKYKQVMRGDDPDDDRGLQPPKLTEFVTLKPGTGIEFEDHVSVYLFNAKRPVQQFLSEGTYYLQLEVGTWPYIAEPKPYRQRWNANGYLWYQGLISEPMPFTIAKDRLITKCM